MCQSCGNNGCGCSTRFSAKKVYKNVKGDKGDTGTAGLSFAISIGVPTGGVTGDSALDINTGDLYLNVGGTWVLQGTFGGWVPVI